MALGNMTGRTLCAGQVCRRNNEVVDNLELAIMVAANGLGLSKCIMRIAALNQTFSGKSQRDTPETKTKLFRKESFFTNILLCLSNVAF